jgi:2-polyprenyl-6-methoxyphenol hydroxylase-like FAD-dependent oxidoreductase
MVARPGVGPDHTAPPNSSGITVIVVGLGLGGLAAAIECHRKGHRVLAFDQVPELKPAGACVDGSLLLTFSDIRGPELIMFLGCIGDSIAIGSNAAKTVAKWGNGIVHDRLQPVLSQLETMDFYDGNGELIVKGGLWGYKRGLGYPAHRGDLAMMFYQHACELGIEFHFGCRVTEYWENDTEAGIIVNNEKFTADCVLGADGIHSKARGPVTSQDARPHSSGYAIYRAWFSADLLNSDPKTRWLPDLAKEQGHDLMQVYVGDDIHCVLSTAKMGKDINWTCMHQVWLSGERQAFSN